MMAMIVGFSVIAVSTIVYAFTELVTKSRLLALLKALGLMASDIVKANVAKWLVYSIIAAVVLPLVTEAFYYWGWEVLSTVYYSPYLGFDVNYCIVTLIILPLVALVSFVVYRSTEVVEELRV
jgi:predicted lysophospholipase L1 biosynthesis ABC-type transport system permease subunit